MSISTTKSTKKMASGGKPMKSHAWGHLFVQTYFESDDSMFHALMVLKIHDQLLEHIMVGHHILVSLPYIVQFVK